MELWQERQILWNFLEHNLKIITIADLVAYIGKNQVLVERVTKSKMPTKYGDFTIYGL